MNNKTFSANERNAPNKAQHSPWTLHRLDDHWNGEKRWSAGVNGPRVYLTCDEETAKLIVRAVNHADKLAEALSLLLADHIAMSKERLKPNRGRGWEELPVQRTARKALDEYKS